MPENETTYHLENAPSGRAKCKKSKEPIGKGELRICTNTYKEGQDFSFTSYCKVKYFVIPPRALKGVSPEEFVDSYLEDRTNDGDYLTNEAKRQEIVDAIAYKPPRASNCGKGAAKREEGEGGVVSKWLAAIKSAMETLPDGSEEEGGERPTKKAKSEGNSLEACARAMRVYGKMKGEDLRSVIRWNLGYGTSGNKDILLLRCIDGHVNGRLARCPTCFKGKLNLNESDAGASVLCRGYFDEESQYRIPCAYTTSATAAPRLQPWYEEEPSEEETEAMKAVTKRHEAIVGGNEEGGDVPQDLIDAAVALDWPIDDIKQAAQTMVDLCTAGSTKVDLPQDEKRRRIAVGKLLMNLRSESPAATALQALESIIKEFGIVAAKQEVKARQKSAMAGSCRCPANAAVLQAFQELGELYFKEGNTNAGMSYKKTVAALAALDYEITESNAKGLGKGKTKVAGIGKGSAEKIHEFLATGSIQKLEEKRAIHS